MAGWVEGKTLLHGVEVAGFLADCIVWDLSTILHLLQGLYGFITAKDQTFGRKMGGLVMMFLVLPAFGNSK